MYQIRDIASMIDAQVMGQAPLTIDWLLTDSRSLCFPENTLFFALRSERGDGHRYIHQLYNRGVRAFVVDTLPSQPCPEAVFLLVPSPLGCLAAVGHGTSEAFPTARSGHCRKQRQDDSEGMALSDAVARLCSGA